MFVTIWEESPSDSFTGFPPGLSRQDFDSLSVSECYIEWEDNQPTTPVVLTSTAVDRGPENPYQEIHFICPPTKKSPPKFYYCQPTQSIAYKIQCFDLNTSQFKIIPIGTERKPKIKRIKLIIELFNASTRF